MKIFNGNLVGVNIHPDHVDVLQFEKTRHGRRVRSVGCEVLPAGSVEHGVIKDVAAVSRALGEACDNARPKSVRRSSLAGCVLPEAKTFVRLITLPAMKSSDIPEAVKWEMEAYIPMSPQDMSYDFSVVDNDKDGWKVLVIASARTVVDDYVAVLDAAGLRPAVVEAGAVAQMRAMAGPDWDNRSVMTVFFDTHSTLLAIVTDGVLLFTAGVPAGVSTLEADLERFLGVSAEKARRLLQTQGIGSYLETDAIFKSLEPSLSMVADEMSKSSHFCESALPLCRAVSKVVLAGSGATLKGLRSYLTHKLGVSVEVADPWAAAELDKRKYLPPLSRQQALSRITTIGLALKELNYEDLD